MKKFKWLLPLIIVLLFLTSTAATAQFSSPLLNNVSTSFASRSVTIDCRSAEEDGTFNYAWGYVKIPLEKQKKAYIFDEACTGALDIKNNDPKSTDFMKSIGAAVIVHESYHLRITKGNLSEARTECRAMRHYDIALAKLGATQEVMDKLMPIMLINHWRLRAITEHLNRQPVNIIFGRVPSYHQPNCQMPLRYDRYLGFPPREESYKFSTRLSSF